MISRLVFFTEKKTLQKSSEPIKIEDISIVIPVKDNQKGIEVYLDHFFKTHQERDFPKEIVIVDNNSEPAIQIPKRFTGNVLPINLVKCATPGPAAARNAGVQCASGKWILFNDSDCIPTETLLSGYQEVCNLSIAYAGNVKALHQDRVSQYYESQEILVPLKIHDGYGGFAPQYLITANALVWRAAFIEVGGFDERIAIAGGEDIDLGLRLSRIGSLSYAFESIVLHDFSDGLFGFVRRFVRYGKGNRHVEELWDANLKPILFRPNNKGIINEVLAKIQYLALLSGYMQSKNRGVKLRSVSQHEMSEVV